MTETIRSSVVLIAALSLALAATTQADDFYKGKTIRLVVGGPPGGGYDIYVRAIAPHLGKHIPGNPSIVVENMPGAGSLVTANYIYSKAKTDGLTIGIWVSGLVLRQVLGDGDTKFNSLKFGWIGAVGKGSPTCAIMAFTGLKTWNDIVNSKQSIKMGGTLAGVSHTDIPTILNNVAGTKFNVISGYGGTSPILMAMQKREVEGGCWTWDSMAVGARALLDASGEDKLIPFVTHKKSQDPEVKNLPLFTDVIKGETNLATYKTYVASYEFERPFTLPPNTPSERLYILRKAFAATLRDPDFVAATKKARLEIELVSGQEIDGYVKGMTSLSDAVKQNLRFLVQH